MIPLVRRRSFHFGYRLAWLAAGVVACSGGTPPTDLDSSTPTETAGHGSFTQGSGGQGAGLGPNRGGTTGAGVAAGGTGASVLGGNNGAGPNGGSSGTLGSGGTANGTAAGSGPGGTPGAPGNGGSPAGPGGSFSGGGVVASLGGAGSGHGGMGSNPSGGAAGSPPNLGAAGATPSGPATFAGVAAIIQQHCALAACHGGGRNPRLTNNSSLYRTLTSTTVKECGGNALVTPNSIANSALLLLPNWECTDLVMPEGCVDMPCLSGGELATIAAWIQAGAPGP